jgi:hypothetical protein
MAELLNESDIRNFYDQLAFKLKTATIAQRKLDLYLASTLNIVRDYVDPDENKISDILADLLKPNGRHGQGDRFLRLFLEIVRSEDIGLNQGTEVEVRREDPTSANRRVDILVDFDKARAVAIENKMRARDQESQLSDYCDHLAATYRDSYVLLYLTPDGAEPTSESIDPTKREHLKENGKLRCISYRSEVQKWLNSCVKDCEAEKVRWFLRDLVEYVDVMLVNLGEGQG